MPPTAPCNWGGCTLLSTMSGVIWSLCAAGIPALIFLTKVDEYDANVAVGISNLKNSQNIRTKMRVSLPLQISLGSFTHQK